MRAALLTTQDPKDPLAGLTVTEVEEPSAPEPSVARTYPGQEWVRVQLRAATLNPHDVWTMRGVGHPPELLPRILGCDGAGVTDDGREVIIAPVIGDPDRGAGDETLDPRRTLLSEGVDGTLAESVLVPARNLVDKPSWLSFAQAAVLPVVWGTAFRLLFTRAHLRPGQQVLVQGSSGGVASAAIALASRAGAVVSATGRSQDKRDFAERMGAAATYASGDRLPARVDVVFDSVGEATWAHSLRCVRPGGTIVTCGATTGGSPDPELHRVFYQQLSVIGSTACTRAELERLVTLLSTFDDPAGLLESTIDRTIGLDAVHEGFRALIDETVLGKVVVTP